MFFTGDRKPKLNRRSRDMDMTCNDINMGMVLGDINKNSIGNKLEIVLNHFLVTEVFLFTKLLHNELRLETLAADFRPLGQVDR